MNRVWRCVRELITSERGKRAEGEYKLSFLSHSFGVANVRACGAWRKGQMT